MKKRLSLLMLAAATIAILSGCATQTKNPIYPAVFHGDVETVRSLIDRNPDLVSKRNNVGQTVLFMAVINIKGNKNRIEIVKLLIAKGADVNAQDNHGNTPLGMALVNNSESDIEVLDILVAHGAKPDNKSLFGVTHKAFAQWLISRGVNVNARNKDQQTPLLRLSESGGADVAAVATLLLAHGADIQAKDGNGATPLHIASLNGRKDTAELLLSKGAQVNATDNAGNTPLKYAFFGQHTITAFISSHGMSPFFYQMDSISKPANILGFFSPNANLPAASNLVVMKYSEVESLLRQHGGHE